MVAFTLRESIPPDDHLQAPALLRRRTPLWISLAVGIAYVLVFGVYIVLSTGQAAESAESVEELRRVEILKGLAFVGATGLFFFVVLFGLLRHIARQARVLSRQRTALVQSERRAMAGILAASVAHDINNILMFADMQVRRLRRDADEGADREPSVELERVLDDLRDLAVRLMDIGRRETPGSRTELDLAEVVRRWVDFASRHREVRPCVVETRAEEGLTIPGNASTIGRMLVNLILNAAQATGSGGRVEVRLRRDGDAAVLEVHDDGPGIPEGLRRDVFSAFYSSKTTGTGLGLLSVKACAEEHGGAVEVGGSELGGALFRIRLPLER